MNNLRRIVAVLGLLSNTTFGNEAANMRTVFLWAISGLLAAAGVCEAQVTFTEYPVSTSQSYLEGTITAGPDGNLWFIEGNGINIARMTTAGVITGEFAIPSNGIYGNGSGANSITTGPDGNLWLTEYFANKIGRITTTGVITEFPIPDSGIYGNGTFPTSITAGLDGNLWFTEYVANKIGRITTAGVITEFAVPSGGIYGASYITAGPDGNLWFTECRCSAGASGPTNIGRITTAGMITEFLIPTGGSAPAEITAGPDGNLWFAEQATNKIGRITTTGVITEFLVPTSGSTPLGITAGPDGNLWFTEQAANQIGRSTTTGVITEFLVPTANSGLYGITAGPDGNLWFVEATAKNIGTATLQPTITKGFNPTAIQSGGSSLVTLTLSNSYTSVRTGGAFTDTLANMSTVAGTVGGTCVGTTPTSLSAGQTSLSFTGITIPASGGCTVTFGVTSSTPGLNPNTTSGVTTAAQSFAYVANSGGNNVSAYAINPATGTLTAVPGSPFAAGRSPISVTVDPTGKFAYVANFADSDVSAYTINPATGALTAVPGSPFPAGIDPSSVTVDPTGKFAYVVNETGFSLSNLLAYSINPATGALSAVPGSPFPGGDYPVSITVDPTGKFAYVASEQEDDVLAYTINPATGALTAVPGSPFAAGSGPHSVIVDPTGKFAYVANFVENDVSAYTINPATGALTAVLGSPFAAGAYPLSVTVDPTGKFAYVANSGVFPPPPGSVSAYTINPATGALSAVLSSPFAAGTNPYSVTVDPTGKFAYVTNDGDNDVSAYSISSTTGALTAVPGSPFAAGAQPGSVVTTQTSTIGLASNTATLTVLSAPTIAKAFNPTSIVPGGSSLVTLTLSNSNASALTNGAFTDTLANMSAVAGTVGGTCVGTTPTSLSAGQTSLSFSGITIPAIGSCSVTFSVTSSTIGGNPNTTSGVTSAQTLTAGTASNTATLTVVAVPTITKAFSPTTITSGASSLVTLTLSNSNASALTGGAFTDTLANMSTVAGTVGGTCVGTTPTAFIAGQTSLSFSGITIPAGGSCTVTFSVTSSTLGGNPNKTSGVTTTQTPTAGTASNTATLTVLAPPTITKVFNPITIQSGGTSLVTLTLSNSNASALTGGAFTEMLGNMSTVAGTVGGTCVGTSPPSLSAGQTSLSFSGITIPASGSCTVTFSVTSSTLGGNPNTASGVTTTQTPTAGSASNTPTLTVLAPSPADEITCAANNLQHGDSYLNICNDGPGASGNICVNLYVIDPSEELDSCCSCPVMPGACVNNLGVAANLLGVSLAAFLPPSVTVELVPALPGASGPFYGCNYSAANLTLANTTSDLVAWGTTLEATPPTGTYATTGMMCMAGTLSANDAASLAGRCLYIIGNTLAPNDNICSFCLPPATPTISIAATAGTPQSAVIDTQFTTQFQATVTEANNVGVPGLTVTFTAPATGASGTFANSGTNITTAVTNSLGIATAAVFTANNIAGSYSVTASAPDSLMVNFSLTNTISITADAPVQMGYAANLRAGESYINITNDGYNGDGLFGPGAGAAGNICVNIFVFDATDEQEVACCSCLVTPNAVVNLGVNADLTSRTLTGVSPTSVSIKLVATDRPAVSGPPVAPAVQQPWEIQGPSSLMAC